MLDIKFIRNNPDVVKQTAKNKNVVVDIDALLVLDEKRRELQGKADGLNKKKKEFAQARDVESGKKAKEQASTLEEELRITNDELRITNFQTRPQRSWCSQESWSIKSGRRHPGFH